MKILFLGIGSRGDVCRKALKDAGHTFVDLVDDADLIVMANHNKILPKEVFSRPKYGAINCHGGKLPQYRGSSPLNWQIINGETDGGISIIKVDEGIDTGNILVKRKFPITSEDTIATVREKANSLFVQTLPDIVFAVGNGMEGSPQKEIIGIQEACYWHHRKPEDSRIDWQQMTAKQVYDLVRATEFPYEAWTTRRNDRIPLYPEPLIKILKAKLLAGNYYGISGRVVRRIDDGVVVIAKDRGVWIDADLKVGEQLY